MRAARIALLVVTVAAVAIGFGTPLFAFHSGGVGECSGCHSMHSPLSSSRLLVGTDQSSACLTCHQSEGDTGPSSYHISTAPADMGPGQAPLQRTPGGDFAWLKKTYTWSVPWGSFGEAGQTHGHNIVATDFGYVADGEHTMAPLGSMMANQLACTSCHDPHGKYRRVGGDTTYTVDTTGGPIIASGSYSNSATPGAGEAVGVYRLLAGDGYEYETGSEFSVDPPHASVPGGFGNSYNQSEATNQVKVAYGTGMSQWCATCHPGALSGSHHPSGSSMSGDVIDNYVAYRGSGIMVVDNSTAYLSLVPYEEGTGDYAVLKTRTASNAPDYDGPGTTGGTVACISCHRAHASGFEYALRWNPESEFLVQDGVWPGTDNGASPQFARGRTEAEMQASYYDRDAGEFATYQRSLCNKCHAQD